MEINSSERRPQRPGVTSALKLDDTTATESLETTRRDLTELRKPHSPVEGLLPHLGQLPHLDRKPEGETPFPP